MMHPTHRLARVIGHALLAAAALSLYLALLVGDGPLRVLLAVKGLVVMTAAIAVLRQTAALAKAPAATRQKP